MRTDELISRLSKGLGPVRPVMSPWRAALLWLALAGIVLGVMVGWSGLREDIAARVVLPAEQINLAAALGAGMAAAVGAFHLASPDRSPRWALLPMPFVLVWLSGLGMECLRELWRHGSLGMGVSLECTRFILGFSLPLTAAMLCMARHATWVRPGPVAALGGLAAGAIGSFGLSLVHHLDASAMVLVWHGSAIAVVSGIAWLLGPRAMRAAAG